MPESKKVEGGDLKSTQDSVPKAQEKCDWLVPVAVTTLIIGVLVFIWQLTKRKTSKLWIGLSIVTSLASVGFLIWHKVHKTKSDGETDKPPQPVTTKTADVKTSNTQGDIKRYGRFIVKYEDAGAIVTDTRQSFEPYRFKKSNADWRCVLRLLKNHATGTDQICETDRVWIGAFQGRNKTAARFCREQVFMQPRWDVSRGRYFNKQYEGRWRLWMNDEITMPEQERIRRFKEAHPHGYGK